MCSAVMRVLFVGKYGDELQVGAAIDGLAGDGRLVHHHDFRITDALGDQRRLRVGRAVIGRHAAELFQLTPAQITGIFRISVQYYNFHIYSLLSASYLRLLHYFIIDIHLCMAQRFNISLRKSGFVQSITHVFVCFKH